jgi:hypothetical protein
MSKDLTTFYIQWYDQPAQRANSQSAQICGCDEGADHMCRFHLDQYKLGYNLVTPAMLNADEEADVNDSRMAAVAAYAAAPVDRTAVGIGGAPTRATTLPVASVELKPSNPKDLIGSDKLPLHLWPETATATGCLALLDGNLKYGRTNWRAAGVKASIYFDALKRHINAWFDEGEDDDLDSGLPHLAHALACLAILVDAKAAGKLTDDRLIRGGYRPLVTELTPHVARLKAKHAGQTPRHYTIADNPGQDAS